MISLMYPPKIIPPKATAGATLVVTAAHVAVLTPFLDVVDSQGLPTTTLPIREVQFIVHIAKGPFLTYVSSAHFIFGMG
jgi:hypothetical protein